MNNLNFSQKSNQNFNVFESSPLIKSFLIGSLSGSCSTLLFQPLDLIKTRLQQNTLEPMKRKNSISVITSVIKNENILNLWKGLSPSLIRCTFGVGSYFMFLNLYQRFFNYSNSLNASDALGLGIMARASSGTILIPFTVIKTRYESQHYRYTSIRNAVNAIYYKEGLKGLSSGLLPTLLRDVPFSGFYLMFYTQFKNWKSINFKNDILRNLLYGLNAGILASVITHPFDVIKTKMQLYPKEFSNSMISTMFIYRSSGMKGFFIGIMPRLLRRTLMTTMTWTFYEEITKKTTTFFK